MFSRQSSKTKFRNSQLIPEKCIVYPSSQIATHDGSPVLKTIGHGGFSTVYEVWLTSTQVTDSTMLKEANGGNVYRAALKQFKSELYHYEDEQQKNEEIIIQARESGLLRQFSHKNIVYFFGVCHETPYSGLLLELCEGSSLSHLINSLVKEYMLPLRIIVDWAEQICDGMAYLTAASLRHRDLKPQNILVKQRVCFCCTKESVLLEKCSRCNGRPMNKLQLKITDFGLTKSSMSVGQTAVGTYAYMSPEVFQQEPGAWSETADVWSFGVVLWVIVSRRTPPNDPLTPFSYIKGQQLEVKSYWPEKWRNKMIECWNLQPAERPKFSKLLKFYKQYGRELDTNPPQMGETAFRYDIDGDLNDETISESTPMNSIVNVEETGNMKRFESLISNPKVQKGGAIVLISTLIVVIIILVFCFELSR